MSPEPVSKALVLADVEVHYGGRRAVGPVSVTCDPGTTLAVIGPNGSGKSTLLKAVAGIAPHAGSIRAPHTALVLQATEVDPALPITVADTVAMGRYPTVGVVRRFGRADRVAIADAMARVEVADLARSRLRDLSGGQRQRVLVAQGLAQEADLLLLDEPASGLDIVSRTLITEAVAAERSAGRIVITTTHDLADAQRADQVLLLSTRVIAAGRPGTVLTEDHLVEAFGGRFRTAGDRMILDDPHHDAAHA